MQLMHQSYKCMKAQQKKLRGCASNSLAHEDLGHFEEAHHWNIQAKFYNENSHQYVKVTKQETLYHKDHGATLKHNCGKKDSSIAPSLFLSHFFCFFGAFFYGLFFLFLFGLLWPLYLFIFIWRLILTCGGIMVSIILSSLGQCSNNDDHHTFIFLTTQQLQLNTQNKI